MVPVIESLMGAALKAAEHPYIAFILLMWSVLEIVNAVRSKRVDVNGVF